MLPFKPAFASTSPTTAVELNQTIATDDYEFTFTRCDWSDAVYPPDTSGAYTYFEGESGKHYFIVYATLKNLAGSAIYLYNSTTVSFQFNGKYQYDGIVYTAVDDATTVDQFAPTDPLETVNLYICALVPDEIMDTFDTVQVEWSLYDLTSNLFLSSDETPRHVYQFAYSKASADKTARDEQIEAEGIPLDALVLNGIWIDLDDSLYAFQLHGQTGWAWTPDGLGSICLSPRKGLGMPSSESKQASFFADRVASYAESQGWSIARSEKISLADGLSGFLNQANHADGGYTAFINIATGNDEYVQIDVSQATGDGLLDSVIGSIRKQGEDDLEACAKAESTSYSTAGISFDTCILTAQQTSYDSLYLHDPYRTVQAYVESYGGDVSSNEDSIWPNLFQYSGEYARTAPEWPGDYAQQFATAHNGWILGTQTIETASSPVDAFIIRAEPPEGPSVYVVAVIPQASGHPTVITMRTQLESARKWSPVLDAMLGSINVTGEKGFWSFFDASQYDWNILMPAVCERDTTDNSRNQYVSFFTNDTALLHIAQTTLVAPRGRYFPFGVAGDNLTTGEYIANRWETVTAAGGISVRLTEIGSSNLRSERIVVDLHSSTDDARYLNITLIDPLDREYAMPLITQIVDGITW